MSRGYGARAKLIASDMSGLLYSYSCYDINQQGWESVRDMEDGEIWIARDALVEPERHEKLKKMPSGKKRIITKRVPRPVSLGELMEAERIQVENASGTWRTEGSVDVCRENNLNSIFFRFGEEYTIVSLVFGPVFLMHSIVFYMRTE